MQKIGMKLLLASIEVSIIKARDMSSEEKVIRILDEALAKIGKLRNLLM